MTEIEFNNFKKKLTKVIDAKKQYAKTNFSFFKGITTISVALIGLLVGLKPEQFPNQYALLLFLTTICLIGLCILFSIIVQFYEVIFYKKEIDAHKQILSEYTDNPKTSGLIQTKVIKVSKFFEISQILTFSSLILSIIALISYVFASVLC